MPPLTLADYHANDGNGLKIFAQAATEIPSAAGELIAEAWANPGETALSAGKTLAEATVMGTAIGYVVPAKGPASIIIGIGLTVPALYSAGKRAWQAYDEAQDPLANHQVIAHRLARDTVSGTTHLGLGLAGGYAGMELGYGLATSRGMFGRIGQKSQRGIMKAENETMKFARGVWQSHTRAGTVGLRPQQPRIDISTDVPRGGGANEIVNTQGIEVPNITPTITPTVAKATVPPERLGFGRRTLGILDRRLNQYLEPGGEYNMYLGTLHGHSRYSDGMGLPKDIYAKAKQEGYDFTAITDHNHVAARGGVKPDDVRAQDQAGTPTVAENPIFYSQTFADAHAATVNGEFVGLVGLELGTIGKVGGGHSHDFLGPEPPANSIVGKDPVITGSGPRPTEVTTGTPVKEIKLTTETPAPTGTTAGPQGSPQTALPHVPEVPPTVGKIPEAPKTTTNGNEGGFLGAPEGSVRSVDALQAEAVAAQHLGGVNHINLLEVPTFLEAVRKPRGQVDSMVRTLTGRDTAPVVREPDIVKYNDGDFKALANHLDQITDTTGNSPVIQLNHPRYRADENPNLSRRDRARDYGQKSFRSRQEWLDRFVDPYVRQIEMIKGGALNPDPVEVVAPGHIDATSFAGYIDKGVHASPTFGRDFHYGDPGGNPGATGIMAKSLDKPSLMEALRERRTIATTNGEKLTATMWGNDRHPMGSILDQAAVPDLTLSVRVGGQIHPEAEYTVKLWGDTKLGDKKLAEVMQETTMTGQELLTAQNQVKFDTIEHKLGRQSAYYVEIQRTDPITGHIDKMWTAPIWVEPLTGGKHSLAMRLLTGNSAQFLFPSF